MCRRIVIDCTWDDDHEDEDAGDLFAVDTRYMTLRDPVLQQLQRFLEDRFFGDVTIRVEELPTSQQEQQ